MDLEYNRPYYHTWLKYPYPIYRNISSRLERVRIAFDCGDCLMTLQLNTFLNSSVNSPATLFTKEFTWFITLRVSPQVKRLFKWTLSRVHSWPLSCDTTAT
uniref:Uncharacterized protein n=1 Tax=Cacopsylla melanoneura TaxID=428564 RepID=A0A8D8Y853_9HEMI